MNRQKYLKYQRQYHKKYDKIYYLKYKKEINLRNRLYYLTHKKYFQKINKLYRKKHHKYLSKKSCLLKAKKYHSDIEFKLKHLLRTRIRSAIKTNSKAYKTLILLGCNISYLKQYLKRKFQKGMSWNNYGKWHIDHIKPCCSFDLSKPEEQKKCFHYTNLQPLWAKDNRKKFFTKDKYIKKGKS